MSVYAATECYEEHATVNESVQKDQGMVANVVLRTPWEKRWTLIAELLSPLAYPWPNTPAGWDTPYPINCACIPDETQYTVVGQAIQYIDALVTVQYGYVDVRFTGVDPQNPDEQVFIAETLEPTAEYLKTDWRNKRWKQSKIPLEEDQAPGLLKRGLNLVRQHFNVRVLSATALVYPGTVNKAPYTSQLLGWQFPAETLLFNPPSLNRTITTLGVKGWNATIKFTFNKYGWNRFYREASNQYETMQVKHPERNAWKDFEPFSKSDFSMWLF